MSKNIFCWFLMLLSPTLQKNENLAEISFFDYQGQVHMRKLSYFIAPSKTQYGVKFMVNVYKMRVENCKAIYQGEMEEYFAAYIEVPSDCQAAHIIKDVQTHGADFVFIDMRDNDQANEISKNIYKIPVFVIDYQENKDLFMLEVASGYKRSLTIFFQMKETSQKQNFVDVQFYYIPSYEYSNKFIEVLSHVHHKLKDRMRFVPHVVTFTSQSQEFIVNNCVGNGNYCAFDPESEENDVTGQDVIMESVRQICIYKQGIKQYFQYMKGFYSDCIHQISEKCSVEVMRQKSIDSKTALNCVTQSFNQMSTNAYENENSILYEEKKAVDQSGLMNFPHIIINSQVYEGTMSQDDLLLSLCSSLHDETIQCRNLDLYDDNDDFSVWQIVLTHIALFFIGLIIMAFVCKFVAKKKYNKELSKAIGKYVSEYSNIKEEDKLVQLILVLLCLNFFRFKIYFKNNIFIN